MYPPGHRTCSLFSAGIGGASNGNGGVIQIYGGDVTATGGTDAAGKPYLIKWASGTDISAPSFTGVTISNDMPEVNSADKKVQFKGSYSPATFTGEDKSKLYLGSGTTSTGQVRTRRSAPAVRTSQ